MILRAIKTGHLVLVYSFLIVAGCSAEDANPVGQPETKGTSDAVSVKSYCGAFAQKYSDRVGAEFLKNSVQVKSSNGGLWISNLFQPKDSRFKARYRCTFVSESSEAEQAEVSVDIILVETREFAKHTQWKDLQLIPISRIVDDAKDTEGYGVFKYLRDERETESSSKTNSSS